MTANYLHAWCECGHYESWHFEGGPCTYVTTVLDDNLEWQIDSEDCTCTQLRISHVDVG